MTFIGKFLALKPKPYIYWKILSSEAKTFVIYTKCARVLPLVKCVKESLFTRVSS